MKQEKEFDRSKCFMFFESYLESAEKYRTQFGTEVAFNYLVGIAKYALYQEESEDGMTNALVSALKNTIDSGQEKRSKGFAGENFDMTKLVAEYIRDHPDASQRTIMAATGVGKTKVGKVQKNIRESGLSIQEYLTDIVYPNLNNNGNFNSNVNNNLNTNNNSETATATSHGTHKQTAPPEKNYPSDKPVKKKDYKAFGNREKELMNNHYNHYQDAEFTAAEYETTVDVVMRVVGERNAIPADSPDSPFN